MDNTNNIELNHEWLSFLQNGTLIDSDNHTPDECQKNIHDYKINHAHEITTAKQHNNENNNENNNKNITQVDTSLYISTKTNIVNVNTFFNLEAMFWAFSINDYFKPTEGLIKKQFRFNSHSKKDYERIIHMRDQEPYYHENVIIHVNNDDIFHDVRKINIGLCKKDIISSKKYCQKGAFYNCIVVIMRVLYNNQFHEVHVKIFKSGKMEIPGIKDEKLFQYANYKFIQLLENLAFLPKSIPTPTQPTTSLVQHNKYPIETILINSNFNCGYEIKRDSLYRLLKTNFKITCNYDPCSYPGIQCKYHDYEECIVDTFKNNTGLIKPGQKHPEHPKCKRRIKLAKIYSVSFFIFRTGNVLIVGRCSDAALIRVYNFIHDILSQLKPQISALASTLNTNLNLQQPLANANEKLSIKRRKRTPNTVIVYRQKQTIL